MSVWKWLAGAVVVAATVLGSPYPAAAETREGLAIIIGNADYHGNVPKAPYAVRDALMMRRQVLTRLGYAPVQVVLVENATKADLDGTLGTAEAPAAALADMIEPGETPLILFYSGHCVPGATDAKPYLLPVDAHPDHAQDTGVALSGLYRTLQALQPRSIFVALECGIVADSFGGPLLAEPMSALEDTLHPPAGVRTIVVAASGMGEIANWDPEAGLGLLTRYLLLGMDGAADSGRLGNLDGKVTLAEMQSWLTEEVGYAAKRRYGRIQRPIVIGPPAGVLAVASPDGWLPRESMDAARLAADRMVRSKDDFDATPQLVPVAQPAQPATAPAAPPPAIASAPEPPAPQVAALPPVEQPPSAPVAEVPSEDLRLESTEAESGPAAAEEAMGLTREQRMAVQQALGRIGYDLGRPDGAFGPMTRKAIASWQQASNQDPTGYLTPDQLAKLSRVE
ncbi:MAG TPA: peptidoglycan-binding protein [Geminicoccaceae bacterium]|nr:peptidoglycan-binding protein [Geminicoccus sp.]HMU52490.1 peptidoglycan-binding protein [Geminicoccaceae bacterium]